MDDFSHFFDISVTGPEGRLSPGDLFRLAGRIQDQCGGISHRAISEMAVRSGVPLAQIWGALTAYPHFKIFESE